MGRRFALLEASDADICVCFFAFINNITHTFFLAGYCLSTDDNTFCDCGATADFFFCNDDDSLCGDVFLADSVGFFNRIG